MKAKDVRFCARALYLFICTALCLSLYAQTVFDLTVQPFSGTEFFADGAKTQPEVLKNRQKHCPRTFQL